MKYYAVFTIVPETGEVTYSSYSTRAFAGKEKLHLKVDPADQSVWVFVEVDDEDID